MRLSVPAILFCVAISGCQSRELMSLAPTPETPGGGHTGLQDAGLQDAGLQDVGLQDAGLQDVGLSLVSPSSFLDRKSSAHVRVLCYNINWDAVFPDGDPSNHRWREFDKRAEFARVIGAVGADIVCLQEINPERESSEVGAILDRLSPVPGGGRWHTYRGADNVIASRFPLSMQAGDTNPSTRRGHAMALVDLPDARFDRDLYLINAHYKSAGGESNIGRRQAHSDAIVSWLKDARSEGGYVDLPSRTPIVVLGDLNVYETDPHFHLTTLITGDIIDERTYGPDAATDWDGTPMTDLLPTHNANGTTVWTWRNDTSEFRPGDLDHVVYTDSSMAIAHSFVLNTATMEEGEMRRAGLERADVALNLDAGYYDHLPIVFDFELSPGASGPQN